MDAYITLKMTPAEFDLVRDALDLSQRNEYEIAIDTSIDTKLRNESRALSVKLGDLLRKLK